MRFTGFLIIVSLLAAGTASVGLGDIQHDYSITPAAPLFEQAWSEYDLDWSQAPWESEVWLGSTISDSEGVSPVPTRNDSHSDTKFSIRVDRGLSLDGGPFELSDLSGLNEVNDGASGNQNLAVETDSPRRLKMPEPVSLVVWAILGAAWAGLAWHRRPSHRGGSQWSGGPMDDGPLGNGHVEEGDRWSKQNRQAILSVIKQNRD